MYLHLDPARDDLPQRQAAASLPSSGAGQTFAVVDQVTAVIQHRQRPRQLLIAGAVLWSSNAVFRGINDVGNAQWTALASVGIGWGDRSVV